MEQAAAFAPCHITGMFEIFDQPADVLGVGSKGAGVSLDLGAKTSVKVEKCSKRRLRITINKRNAESAQVSRHVVEAFSSRFNEVTKSGITVEHEIETPIGAGFGTSGAAALSLALALNEALGVGMSRIEAAKIAHVAEVECRTGLGTVTAETFGGLEIRTKPGAPGIGEITQLPFPNNAIVACHFFGPLSTPRFLSDTETCSRINKFGGESINKLLRTPTIDNFMMLSRQFAENVGLITRRVRDVLNAADDAGVVCSMPMFGESAFTITDDDSMGSVLQIFRETGPSGQTVVSKINCEGAHLLR
jgi:pantoate kinase